MRIVVDAFGSDNRPVPDVEGAVEAARHLDDTIILVGHQDRIYQELDKHQARGLVDVVDASQEILMVDKPSTVGKEKPHSSMHIGMNMVKEGQADAFVTAGNTGAAHAIAMLNTLGRIRGIKRPALSIIFPFNGRRITFLDVGANADAKAEWLAQFAVMGGIYAEKALGLRHPRIGILSNGEEEGKGTQLVRDTDALIQKMPFLNYIGNVEPVDITQDVVDVVVTDGFTGNILVKTFEASTRYLASIIRDELQRSVFTSIGGLLARPAFRRARDSQSASVVGGAPLLGVNGVVIIGHGSSDSLAIRNAIYQAKAAVNGQIIQAIREGVANLPVMNSEER
ncbi:MAG: phosphate acyltransferase PlsX [Anaerolineae bacterium]